MKRVLLLDHQADRRDRLTTAIRALPGVCVDARERITRCEYESGIFNVALVHLNNVEGPFIEDGWLAEGTSVVLFSGSNTAPLTKGDDGLLYASARHIENPSNLHRLLVELLSK